MPAMPETMTAIAIAEPGGPEVLVPEDRPVPRAGESMGKLIGQLQDADIERIVIDKGVTPEELSDFVQTLAGREAKHAAATLRLKHIRVGRLQLEKSEATSIDANDHRRLYNEAVSVAGRLWDSAQTEGMPDADAGRSVVDALAHEVSQNRTALLALTALKSYDSYTFTHMVNVSILTMAQARALGIDGRLLREFGMSALMHDIGKVKTPTDILNKPEKLTDRDFEILKQHTVEGAEILRGTPEMPALAPVVAFEHHLRLDGSGYPAGVRRTNLNLATMLCGIADVYDAMRSQRAYQQAFPSDRILEVLKRNDGHQFDQNLVRRFTQLLGIYPPGNLVRLDDGSIGVVLAVHAPDPYKPRVKLVMTPGGEMHEFPIEINLWELPPNTSGPKSVTASLDPAQYAIDPLTYLESKS